MKNLKNLLAASAFLSMALLTQAALAGGTGVIDFLKIKENYTVAQEFEADTRVKEAELQKFVSEAQAQIEAAKTPLEKKNIEAKLSEQYSIKFNAARKQQTEKWEAIERNILNSIKEVSSVKKFDIVLSKQVVFDGGCDITQEVLDKLNKETKETKKK